MTLTTDRAARLPLLYRVGRISTRPASVGISGRTVQVNQSGNLPEAGSETEVNEAPSSAWFYDAAARRLIVKLVP